MKRQSFQRCIKRACSIVLLFIFTACTHELRKEDQDIEVIDISEPSREQLQLPVSSMPRKAESAVDQLLSTANKAIADKNYNKAAALIERAVRLAPRDGRAYFGLAQVHYFRNNLSLSQSFVNKAKALAMNDNVLLSSIFDFSQRYLNAGE